MKCMQRFRWRQKYIQIWIKIKHAGGGGGQEVEGSVSNTARRRRKARGTWSGEVRWEEQQDRYAGQRARTAQASLSGTRGRKGFVLLSWGTPCGEGDACLLRRGVGTDTHPGVKAQTGLHAWDGTRSSCVSQSSTSQRCPKYLFS